MRCALVIGNDEYRRESCRRRANDAGVKAGALRTAGFAIAGARNLPDATLRDLFREFLRQVAAVGPDAAALVYLAGFGLQFAGDNYFFWSMPTLCAAAFAAVEFGVPSPAASEIASLGGPGLNVLWARRYASRTAVAGVSAAAAARIYRVAATAGAGVFRGAGSQCCGGSRDNTTTKDREPARGARSSCAIRRRVA